MMLVSPKKVLKFKLTWIAKSNSLRRSAKEKTEELKAVDEQLDENCFS